MTKATIGLGTLGLGATATIAAPLAVKFGGGSSGEIVESENVVLLSSDVDVGKFPELSWTGTKIPISSSKDVNKKYKEVECLKDYFSNGEEWENGESIFPGDLVVNTSSDSKGCLIVEYYKQTYGGDKWWGEFKLIWSWSNDKQGFITSFNTKTDSDGLKIDSSLYLLKKGEQDKWLLNYKQENGVETISNKTGLTNKFPKSATTIIANSSDYWGFNPDPEKICKSNECTDTEKVSEPKSFKWNWTKDSGNTGINDWCTNLKEWFEELSPNGVWEVIKKALENLKGTWTGQSQ